MYNKAIIGALLLLLIGGAVVIFSNQAKKSILPTSPGIEETGSSGSTQESFGSKDFVISLSSTGFVPNPTRIKVGTTVIWKNDSGVNAAIYSADHPTHLIYPPLNLGAFQTGATKQFTFTTPGNFKYHNHFNPTQTGTIIVEE